MTLNWPRGDRERAVSLKTRTRCAITSRTMKWVEHLSENGESYFHQPSTGETVWDRPDGEITPASLQIDEKWLKADEGNGDNYWYDETSGRTTWSDRSQG